MTTPNGSSNEMDSIIPEGGTPKTSKPASPLLQKAAIKPVKRVKPLVEGINTPKSTQDVIMVKPNLSPKEKELIAEPENLSDSKTDSASGSSLPPIVEQKRPETRLMPESVSQSLNKKNHHIGRWLLIFVILFILVVGGYEFYVWKLSSGQEPVVGNFHPASNYLGASGQPDLTTPSDTVSSTPSTTTSAPTSTPAVPVLQIKVSSTPTGFLNVRSTPSSSGKVLTQIKPGEVYTYTKVQNNWYFITYSGFEQGWVSGQYVTKQ